MRQRQHVERAARARPSRAHYLVEKEIGPPTSGGCKGEEIRSRPVQLAVLDGRANATNCAVERVKSAIVCCAQLGRSRGYQAAALAAAEKTSAKVKTS